MLFLGGIGVIFLVFAEPVVRPVHQRSEVIPLAAACLRIISYGNVGYAYAMVMLQAFNGAGDTVTPTIVNFFGFLASGNPAGVPSSAIHAGLKSNGVFILHRRSRKRHRRCQHRPVPPRPLEAPANLTPSSTDTLVRAPALHAPQRRPKNLNRSNN
jgi:hypothetical protein